MRIIAGTLRSKKLAKVSNASIRPTSDRLRESVFNILADRVSGAVTLDLFAGTGAMGIEALSRGAQWATFLDHSKTAVQLINRNLSACRLTTVSRVVVWDATRNLNCLKSEERLFNLIFIDPPYHRGCLKPALTHLARSPFLARDTRIVVEHDPREGIPEKLPFTITDQRNRSKTIVTFLRTVI